MAVPRIFDRPQIARMIAAGDSIVILNDVVLRLNGWKEKHPGGKLVIDHMVGRDASTEISISHSPEVVKLMYRFRIGRMQGPWDNFVPPIQGGDFSKVDKEEESREDSGYSSDGTSTSSASSDAQLPTTVDDYPNRYSSHAAGLVQTELEADLAKYPSLDPVTQRKIGSKFNALHKRVQEEGYYDCRMSEYAKELARYSTLFGLFLWTLSYGWYVPSACFLGLFWHQIMFTAHDAGHRGITHDITTDTLIGIFIGNLCCGLSIGWWKSSHNVHHLVTNHPEHDPDIQNVPLFATSPAFFSSIKSSYYDNFTYLFDRVAELALPYQHYTYYPIMAVARFNLYFLSWAHLLSPRSRNKGVMWWTRPTEIAAIVVYISWYFGGLLYLGIPTWWDRAVFLLVSHVVTMPLHVQITLSHWGTSTTDLGPSETFAQRQLRTTMDIRCPPWLDFIHGGLQFQAVHHLFPRVPRHNLRALQSLVREFCRDSEIEYLLYGFGEGNGVVVGRLREVAALVGVVVECGGDLARGKVGGHY
ncbi:hypothetical protein MBLNU230_g2415t1 [Neophaeotheca triangularis]